MIEKGNIRQKIQEHPETRGWFAGNFISENSLLHSENFEAKYAIHKPWEVYVGSTINHPRKTITILLSGKIKIHFSDAKQTIILDTPLDYLADTEVPGAHTVEALAESVLLAIRDLNP